MIALLLALALAAPPDDVVAACDAAVEAMDQAALQACVEAWVLADARDPNTDWYAFHLSVVKEDTTAAVSARNRAIARGLDGDRLRAIQRADLPPNPMVLAQKVFLAVVLCIGGVIMVWARVRAMRNADG